MHSFNDSTGATWNIQITVADIKRVRSLLGIDLANAFAGDDEPLVVTLMADDARLADVLYCLVKDQADGLGVTDEAFGRRLGGGALAEGQKAFVDEWLDFFQSRGRLEAVELITQATAMMTAARDEIMTRLKSGKQSMDSPESAA